jgi:hypothetical protein
MQQRLRRRKGYKRLHKVLVGSGHDADRNHQPVRTLPTRPEPGRATPGKIFSSAVLLRNKLPTQRRRTAWFTMGK